MKVLITGGHFSPALSLIEELGKNHEVVIVGRKNALEGDTALSFEYKVAQEMNLEFKELKAARFQRRFTPHTVPSLLRFPRGVIQAKRILKQVKPDVVLSFGGYIGLTMGLATVGTHIPLVIHEQTQGAGVANKWSSRIAAKICISFKSSEQYFPRGKTVFTGNPVRRDVFEVKKAQNVSSNLPMLYVTGGSAGAYTINRTLKDILPELLTKFIVIHQTGNSELTHDFDDLNDLRETLSDQLKKRYVLKQFVYPDEIGWILKNADLVIGRSGINTVVELLALGKMALLIPIPDGQKGEQLENAKLLKKVGLGDYITQDILSSELLQSTIEKMINDKKEYLTHAQKAQEYYIPHATENIISVLLQVSGSR